jgi:hypothetical protein
MPNETARAEDPPVVDGHSPAILCPRLVEMMAAYEAVLRGRPHESLRAAVVVKEVLEIALKSFKRNSCSAGQVREIEVRVAQLRGMSP